MSKNEFEQECEKINDTSLDYQIDFLGTKEFENKYNQLMKEI